MIKQDDSILINKLHNQQAGGLYTLEGRLLFKLM